MDFNQMVDAHIKSGAEFTVSAIRQPIGMADQFGVIETTADDPTRIAEFLEKPTSPKGLPDSPGEILASMGNYVANADAVSYTHLRAHETVLDLVCRLLL